MPGLRLGVVANEFFAPELQRFAPDLHRFGGFGWAARAVAQLFEDPALGVEVSFLTGATRESSATAEQVIHGRRLVLRSRSVLRNASHVRATRPDVLLLIDYRRNYQSVCWSLPRTPIIAWMRDPRPPEDIGMVAGIRVPGAEGSQPKGTLLPSSRSLRLITRVGRWTGRPVRFATTCHALRAKTAGMLDLKIDPFPLLPNPVTPLPVAVGPKSPEPLVVVLGRLDPYKRPWLAVELARRFPHVEFQFVGQAHHRGAGAWEPQAMPPNAHLLGHRDGAEKYQRLSSAWALLNTSVHEGLAVSFLEALACETPLVAGVDPDGIVSRFGRSAGTFPGTGLAGLGALERALADVLDHQDWRRRTGIDGRQFVERTHSRDQFRAGFQRLCGHVGVRCPNAPADGAPVGA